MYENRTVYGYLDRAFYSTTNVAGKIDKGLIKVLFEEVDRKISKINTEEYFDDREEVFLYDGFESLASKYQKKLLKIITVPNTNDQSDGQTKYVTFKNKITDTNKNVFASIIDAPVPDPLNLDVALPNAPHTKVFLIKNEKYVYGPFSLERQSEIGASSNDNEGKLKPLTGKSNGFPSLKPGYIFKYDYESLKAALSTSLVNTTSGEFILDLSSISKAPKEAVEFFTQQNVLEFFASLANKRIIQPATVTTIKKELNSLSLGELSKDVILSVVKNASNDHSTVKEQLFQVIEQEVDGQKLLELTVESQSSKYEAKWKSEAIKNNQDLYAEIQQNETKLKNANDSINEAQRELTQIERKIEERIEKLEQESGFEEELKQKRLTADLELESKRKELAELKETYKQYKTVEELETKLKELQTDLKSEQRREIVLEETIDKLKKQIEESDSILQERLREMVPYVSSIIQAPIPSKEHNCILSAQKLEPAEVSDYSELANNIVNGICTKFHNQYERDYSPAMIASFLVANLQNFITIFAGSPGIGKTSFVRIFNQIIGLDNRFKEVAVGKSWTSEREFIGFYNSLTDSFSPSPSGIYQYLKGIENDSCMDSTYQLMLLDEANLSPIEHYAAVLLNVADIESARSIPAGRTNITLPPSLRVIGTVNHDMTTEPLSARLLDRAPVIPFESFIDSDNTQYVETEINLTLSKNIYNDLFGSESKLKVTNVSFDNINTIIEILKASDPELGIPFIISKRKIASIKNYISVLTPILRTTNSLSFEDALVLATDYACLYFVLPTISGNGNGVKTRLNKVVEKMQDNALYASSKKLEDMLIRGEYHLDTFNFFTY